MAFNDTISQLTGSSTFYDWFIKENDEIISKLNQITVSGVTSGDGVLASTNLSSGLVTVSIGGTSGTIQAGLTFAGPVSFTGEVVIPNTSYKITGITLGTSGYTFGSVVRINSSGYTAAKANDPDSAEVIGVISSRNASYSVVTVLGKIDGDFTQVAGSTLSPGCVYFLSGQTAGYITTTEPTTIGYVSKPVIIGVGATSGVVLQYRGNYLNSSGSGSGISGSNKITITIDKSITNPSSYGFSAGNFISFAPDILAGNTFFHQWLSLTGRTAIGGWFLSGSQDYATNLDGVITPPGNISVFDFTPEENFVVGMIESVNESAGSYNVYQIITHGTTTVIPQSITNSPTKQGSWRISGTTYNVNSSGVTGQLKIQDIYRWETNGHLYVGQVFDSSPSYWHVDIRSGGDPFLGVVASSYKATSQSESLTNGLNYTFNGDFSIWQRDTAKNSQYTTSGNIYFADNWIRRQSGIASGSSQYIQRQNFSITSTEVEGNPEYYLDMKCIADPVGADPTGGEYSVGHVIENIETFNGGEISVSFYAKCSQPSYSANVYFARYSGGSQISKDTIGSVDLTTTWTKYNLTYEVPSLSAGSYSDDYVEIGVDLIPLIEEAYDASVAIGTSLYVSLASMVVYSGSYAAPPHIFEKYEDKLRKARRFYYTTYTSSQTIGSKTMLNSTDPVLNTISFSFLPTKPYTIYNLPTEMREEPTVTVYSPKGVANEMYNQTAGRDLKATSGTKGYNDQLRSGGAPGTQTVSTTSDASTIKININTGAVPFDVINLHLIADASYPI